MLLGSDLKKVVLAKGVLGVASVELEHLLDGVEALDVQRQGLGAEEPSDALTAGRGGEGAIVLVDAVGVKVGSQTGEVKVTGLGVGTRGSNVLNVSEDRVEQRSGVAELGQLEDEANDGDRTSWGNVNYLSQVG